MNLLFLSGYNINPHDGGIARITHTLASLFGEKGHIVWYLGYCKVSDDDKDKQLYFPIGKPKATVENLEYLKKIIVQKQIDVVVVQKNPCKDYIRMLYECKAQRNIQIISCFHNLILTQILNYAYTIEYQLKKKKLSFVFTLLKTKLIRRLLVRAYIVNNRGLYKYIVDHSDYTVVLSEGHKRELLRMVGRQTDESIRVIPNCCDENTSCQIEKNNEILWVGNVDCSVKRIDYMIHIWSIIHNSHPNWTLIVLGDGPSLKEMKERVKSQNIRNVRFEGRVIPDTFYDRAKILCVTSAHESFSLVTIEAKMHGVVPVVQDSFPIAREIVADGIDGVLVKPFDYKDFCEKLNALMSNERLIERYSRQARANSQQYSSGRIFALWNALINDHKDESTVTN